MNRASPRFDALMTLGEILTWRAHHDADRPAFRFLDIDGQEQARFSYAELYQRSADIAGALRDRGLRTGDRVIVSCAAAIDFIPAFMGASLAGMIPVPTPVNRGRRRERIDAIVADCAAAAWIKDPGDNDAAFEASGVAAIIRDHVETGRDFQPVAVRAAQPAFLQYTSGSTGHPKGVVVTHEAWLANARMIREAFGHDAQSRFANWLPLFHDMGLVGTVLQPLFLGAESILLPTAGFVERPARWLRMVSDYHAHTSGAPDSAYLLCARDSEARQMHDLDLSAWQVAFNGAEPVRAATLSAFAKAFEAVGFEPRAFLPCYGLAEATLLCSGASRQTAPKLLHVSTPALHSGALLPVAPERAAAKPLVSLGPVWCDVLIATPGEDAPAGPNRIGEICLSGPNVASRYWSVPGDQMPRLVDGEGRSFLRTGDLGCLLDGELYVVGRQSDLLIVAGHNHHPQDIEDSIRTCHPLLAGGQGAVLSLDHEQMHSAFGCGGECASAAESIVIVHEIHRHLPVDQRDICIRAIREAVAREHGIAVAAVALVRHGSIELTTSGKVRRGPMRQKLCDRQVDILRVWTASASRQPASSHAAAQALALAMDHRQPPEVVVDALGRLYAACMGGDVAIDGNTRLSTLGMSSLQAMDFISRVHACSGRRLSIASLYGGATLSALANQLQREKPAPSEQAPTACEPDFPRVLGPSVAALWMRRKALSDAPFLLSFVVHCDHEHSAALLEAARRLPQRHPALARRFAEQAGRPVLLLEPQIAPPEVRVAAQEGLQAFTERLQSPLDLAEGPLRLMYSHAADGTFTLMVVVHHIVADFTSLAIVARDLLHASMQGEALDERPVTFTTLDALPAPEGESELVLEYWKRQLSGCSWPRIIGDFESGDRAASRPLEYLLPVPSDAIAERAAHFGHTPFTLLLTAYVIALWRHSPSDEVVVAVPVSMRNDAVDAGRVDYLVNPLPLRIMLDERMSHADVAMAVRQALFAAIDHRDTTLGGILLALRSEGQVHRTLTLDHAAIHLCLPSGLPAQWAGLALRRSDTRVRAGPFSLSAPPCASLEQTVELVSVETPGGLQALVRIDAGRLSPASATLFAARMSHCLQTLVETPAKPIHCHYRPTASETKSMLAWGTPANETSATDCLHTLFDAWACKTPDAIALVHGARQLSYAELQSAVTPIFNQILHATKARSGERIGLLIEDPVLLVAALLATLRAGCVAMALNPDAPEDYLEQRALGAKPQLLVTDRLVGTDLARICRHVADVRQAGSVAPWHEPVRPVDCHAPAYLVFTSGSTGTPRGIEQSHSAFALFLKWQARTLGIGPNTRVAQIAVAGFDVSLCEIFGALCFGATLCLPERQHDLAPGNFIRWLKRARINSIQVIASYMSEVLRWNRGPWPSELRSIANVGEALTPPLAAEILRRASAPLDLFNIYGPSEVVAASCHRVAQSDLRRTRIPVGRPIDGRTVQVLDASGGAVPVGMEGDIWIESWDMPHGYAFGQSATGSGFVTTPDAALARKGRYRTGDRGRWLADGLLEVAGRLDNQIKLRGVRIELGEIESVLLRHQGVSQCLVAVEHSDTGSAALLALVVPREPVTSASLREFCAAALPHTHVPAEFLVVDTLPRLLNGKLDRSALTHRPCIPDAQAESTSAQTVSHDERQMIDLWAHFFPGEAIDASSNFFALGGDSILAMQLLNEVNRRTGTVVSIGAFLAEPTVCAITKRVALQAVQAPFPAPSTL